VLVPQGSANADIGQSIRTAAQLAITKINAGGGYHDQGVSVRFEDEGVTGIGIDPAIATLLGQNVDAIIGPASSINALNGLSEIVGAGVVACSPTASASLLDDFPDQNLFFRTIPSDSLQAVAIAEAVDRTGANMATVVYIDDDYGQSFVNAVDASLQQKGIDHNAPVAYSADDRSINLAAQTVARDAPGVVVVIGDATSGPVMLDAIDAQMTTTRPEYIVNDAMRRPTASAEPLGGALAGRVFGISPEAYSTDADFLAQLGGGAADPSPFAANAFDCANLIALAAVAANSTQPAAIAAQIPAVSDSGTPCIDFPTCRAAILAGSNIDYDGPGGTLTLGANGDPSAATFEEFGFDASGRDVHENVISVRA